MTDFHALEYDSLRAAIRVRAILAPALLVAVTLGWAALTLWIFTTDVISLATLVPLLVLAAGFEALYALHISAERLARYLQVAYEEPIASASPAAATIPRWETTSLHSALFVVATIVNYLPAAVSGTFEELVGIGLAHALFVARLIIASRFAARRRTEDLERLRTLFNTPKNGPPA